MEPRAGVFHNRTYWFIPATLYVTDDSLPLRHLIWSTGNTRCMGTSSKAHHGHTTGNAFTAVLHSPLSCTIIHSCYPDILLSFKSFHTIHPSHLWPNSQISQPSQQIPLFSSPTTLPPCHNHLNTHCSAISANSLTTPLHLVSHSVHKRYSTYTPQTLHLHYI